jgi:hypothetical protein
MLITATLPAGLAVAVVSLTMARAGAVQVALTASRTAVACPPCATPATRIHRP